MKTERELFLHYWTDNNLPYDGDDDDMKVAWTAWKASSQREGYKLVPIEPTEEMLDAARRRQWDDLSSPLEDMDTLKYKAMIGAVP